MTESPDSAVALTRGQSKDVPACWLRVRWFLTGALVSAVITATVVTLISEALQDALHDALKAAGLVAVLRMTSSVLHGPALTSPVERRQMQNLRMARISSEAESAKASILARDRELDVFRRRADVLEASLKSRSSELAALRQQSEYSTQRAIGFARRASARSAKAARRSVAGAFGEAVPVVGVGVVAGLVALEVFDACSTMREAREMDDSLPALEGGEYCGYAVPTKEQLIHAVSSNARDAYERGARAVNESREIIDEKLPKITWKEAKNAICGAITFPGCT